MKKAAGNATESGYLKFNHFFKWNRVLLKILGIWPLEANSTSKFEYFGAVFLTVVLTVVVVSEWADLIAIWGQFDAMIENLTASLTVSLSLSKILIIRCNFKTLQYLFAEVRSDWCVDHTCANMKAMQRRSRISRIFSIASPAFSITVSILYAILPLTTKSSEISTEIFVPFPLRAKYFFDPTPTPIYEIVYLAQSIACSTSAVSHSSIDSFLAALGLHACGQFEILGQALRAADNNRPMIKNLVKRHLRLVKFVEKLEHVYSTIIFTQLLVSSLAVCGIGYRFIMVLVTDYYSYFKPRMNRSLEDGNAVEIAKFSLYLIATLIEIFIFCYAGQCLIDESTRLSEAAYDCRWYDMKPSDAKAFLLIQSRAQLPLQITALNFCGMSFECFADILKRSASYLSVIRAMKS